MSEQWLEQLKQEINVHAILDPSSDSILGDLHTSPLS